MYTFYQNDKIIVGISKVMYKDKWYTVLYKTKEQDFLIIKYKKQYIKIFDKDVEDCEYNNLTVDSYGNIRKFVYEETIQAIERGKQIVRANYNIYGIYASINDYQYIISQNLHLFFKDERLINYVPLSDCEAYGEWFDSFINKLIELVPNNKRRGINSVMQEFLSSSLYSTFNKILRSNNIYKDSDAYKFKSLNFIMEFENLGIEVN